MKYLKSWKIFETLSYPTSIEYYTDLIYEVCSNMIDEYLDSDIKLNKTFNFTYSDLKDYIFNNKELFIQFPIEDMEIYFVIKTDENFNFGGESKMIRKKENDQTSYLQESKSKLVNKSIFYRCDIGIGLNRESDIQERKRVLRDVINHEVQHGYDNYNRSIVKDIDIFENYIFYSAVHYMADAYDSEGYEYLSLLFEAIYNSSELEVKSIIAEPGFEFLKSEWNGFINKRNMNYNFDNLLDDLKKDANYDEYASIPEELLDVYIDACVYNNIDILSKYIKICEKDFESFVRYWVKIIKKSITNVKRKTSKRINGY